MNEHLDFNSSSVQHHINILQDIIKRLSNNSSSCKTWCIALVSAIFTLLAKQDEMIYLYFAIFPIVIFWFLDAYYLSRERAFIRSYRKFVRKIHNDRVLLSDLYDIRLTKIGVCKSISAFFSVSTSLLYIVLIAILVLFVFIKQ